MTERFLLIHPAHMPLVISHGDIAYPPLRLQPAQGYNPQRHLKPAIPHIYGDHYHLISKKKIQNW